MRMRDDLRVELNSPNRSFYNTSHHLRNFYFRYIPLPHFIFETHDHFQPSSWSWSFFRPGLHARNAIAATFFAAHEVKLPTCFCNKSPGSALIRRRRLLPIFGCLPPHDGPRRKATRRERNEMPSSSSLASPRPSIRPVPVLPCYAHLRP